MADIPALEAATLARLIAVGDLSPVEVLERCLARQDALNPTLNAIVAQDREAARAEARAREQAVRRGDRLGPLHGVPVAVKDVHATAGLRTTWGSPLYADHVPEADDRLVAALRRAGAVILGKANTPEFAAGAHTVNPVYGLTRNPVDPTRSAGGSSGGSAVAVATGMAPVATGTDLGGSLRVPAAFCGVVGFRPSAGLVPSDRPEARFSDLDVDGPMARTVGDIAVMLSAWVPGWSSAAGMVDPGRVRVAVSADLGRYPLDPQVRTAFAAATGRLTGTVASLEAVVPPLDEADALFDVLRGRAFVALHGPRCDAWPEMVGANVADNVRQGRRYDAAAVRQATNGLAALRRRFAAFMRRHDVLVCPAAPVPPFPADAPFVRTVDGHPLERYFHWLGLTYALTLTGCPVVTLPAGRHADGTPFGVQLCGRPGGDARLLEIAAALAGPLAPVGRLPEETA